jgi:hypothetical protein
MPAAFTHTTSPSRELSDAELDAVTAGKGPYVLGGGGGGNGAANKLAKFGMSTLNPRSRPRAGGSPSSHRH